MLIDLILATDMKRHFEINSQFGALHRLSKSGVGGLFVSGGDKLPTPLLDSVKTPLDETERLLSLKVSIFIFSL